MAVGAKCDWISINLLPFPSYPPCIKCSQNDHTHNSSGMGIFRLSPEFRLFDGPQGHSRESSKFGEKNFMCILKPRVADAVRSSRDFVRHFIPIQFVLSYLRGVVSVSEDALHTLFLARWRYTGSTADVLELPSVKAKVRRTCFLRWTRKRRVLRTTFGPNSECKVPSIREALSAVLMNL